MDVKWLLSSGRVEGMAARREDINPVRYNAFCEAFGEDNIGLIPIEQLIKEIETGVPADVYSLGHDLDVRLSEERGVSGDLFIASGFDLGDGSITTRKNLEEVMGYLDDRQSAGDIGKVVNSKYSNLFEDKISFVGLAESGLLVPATYNFQDRGEFHDFIRENGKHVVKHRFGYNGIKNFLIDESNLGLLDGEVIADYIVQEVLPIESETRLIFYEDDFLAARKIIDRTRPWEKGVVSSREHVVESYTPTGEEIDEARAMFSYADGTVGSVDTVQLSDGRRQILEFNGFGTGFGYPGGVYDLNHDIAERLKESFVKK
jgi:hypothetical protein